MAEWLLVACVLLGVVIGLLVLFLPERGERRRERATSNRVETDDELWNRGHATVVRGYRRCMAEAAAMGTCRLHGRLAEEHNDPDVTPMAPNAEAPPTRR